MKPILEVNNLSKRFKISSERKPYLSLRDSLTSVFSRKKNQKYSEFWALSDVSFEVNSGATLAIIGRNGAGKSTLLKVLSKITPPTSGDITLRGRIASLLEVGTGFHPELTGRENIYLNGSILGLNRKEINLKFSEIVDFADVSKFLDTPLKHYSSGMQLRLAFAVAAHLEPEILVIDEVLAVGDSVFQQKCIQKMTDVSRSGRTILFVSHNFSAIRSLCKEAIVLNKGTKVFQGEVEEAIDYYNSSAKLSGKVIDLISIPRTNYAQQLIFDKLIFESDKIKFSQNIKFKIRLKSAGESKDFKNLDFGFNIKDKYNNSIIHCSNRFLHKHFDHFTDSFEYLFEIENYIKPGIYYLSLFLRANDVIQDWLLNDEVALEIEDGNPYNYENTKHIQGLVLPIFDINQVPESTSL